MVITLKKKCMHVHYMHARTHSRPSFYFLNKITFSWTDFNQHSMNLSIYNLCIIRFCFRICKI